MLFIWLCPIFFPYKCYHSFVSNNWKPSPIFFNSIQPESGDSSNWESSLHVSFYSLFVRSLIFPHNMHPLAIISDGAKTGFCYAKYICSVSIFVTWLICGRYLKYFPIDPHFKSNASTRLRLPSYYAAHFFITLSLNSSFEFFRCKWWSSQFENYLNIFIFLFTSYSMF